MINFFDVFLGSHSSIRDTAIVAVLAVGAPFVSFSLGLAQYTKGLASEKRDSVGEIVAKYCSLFAQREDIPGLREILGTVISKNPELLSAVVRDGAGNLLVRVGDTSVEGLPDPAMSFLSVPLSLEGERWGTAELRFGQSSFLGGQILPMIGLSGLVVLSISVPCFLFLSVRGRNRRSSAARRVRSTLDTLAEGALLLEGEETIVLANQAFGLMVDMSATELEGRKISEFEWSLGNGAAQGSYPWKKVANESLSRSQAGVVMRLDRGGEKPRILSVNASPMLGEDGKRRGILVTFNNITELQEARDHLEAKVAERTAHLKQEITERKRVEEELRNMPRMIIVAQEDERRRMARELHDGVNQTLTSVKYWIQTAESNIADQKENPANFATASELLGQAIKEVREISKRLRPGTLDDLGLASAIRDLVKQIRDRATIRLLLPRLDVPRDLPEEIELAAYRIVQEALNNVEKHSGAGRVEVQLYCEDGFLELRIEDDGNGFDMPGVSSQQSAVSGQQSVVSGQQSAVKDRTSSGGLGLIHIRERAQILGGAAEISSVLGEGTKVLVRIPVPPTEKKMESPE